MTFIYHRLLRYLKFAKDSYKLIRFDSMFSSESISVDVLLGIFKPPITNLSR